MRILITTEATGAVWAYGRELSTALLDEGCSVALVSLGRIPNQAQLDWAAAEVSRRGSQFRFAACDAPLEWMHENWGAMSQGEPLLERIAGDFRADLMVSSQFCFGALKCDLPRVVVAHGDVLSRAQVCRSEPMPETAWLARYRSLVANGLRHADALVAPTQWMLSALAANFQLPRQTQVIAHGRTIPAISGNGQRRLQAVTAGRLWDESKNLKLMADIDPVMPLLVAGEIEHQTPWLTPVAGKAMPLGALDEEELLALFRQSSIYICMSRYEPFGLEPLEPALCGCAVLANDIPTLREVWGDAALFFQDAESLSSLLTALCDDRRLLDRARSCAQHRARQLTARNMADGYLSLLQGILQPAMAGSYVA